MDKLWTDLIGLRGSYVSDPIPILLNIDGANTSITWEYSTPSNTTLQLMTSISIDRGTTWSEWKTCYLNGSVPNISPSTPLVDAYIKFKFNFTTSANSITPEVKNIYISFSPVLEFNNIGDIANQPEIWITKIGNGNISLINTSDNNREFKFENLLDGETVYVNNENQNIETSLPVTYRYSNFNDTYLKIPIGVNIFKINGNAKIQLRTEFQVLG